MCFRQFKKGRGLSTHSVDAFTWKNTRGIDKIQDQTNNKCWRRGTFNIIHEAKDVLILYTIMLS